MGNQTKHMRAGARIAGIVLVAAIVAVALLFLHALGELISDSGYFRFDREHNLPHGYGRTMERRLAYLREALLQYAQHHKGRMPEGTDQAEFRRQLSEFRPKIRSFENPATHHYFVFNPSLAGKLFRSVAEPDATPAFYDPSPPETYKEVYFVTISGMVGHTSSRDWDANRAQSIRQSARRAEEP